MSLCSLIPLLTGLGTALFGGLAAWQWFKGRLDGMTAECEVSNANASRYNAQFVNLKSEYDSYRSSTDGELETWKTAACASSKITSISLSS